VKGLTRVISLNGPKRPSHPSWSDWYLSALWLRFTVVLCFPIDAFGGQASQIEESPFPEMAVLKCPGISAVRLENLIIVIGDRKGTPDPRSDTGDQGLVMVH